MIASKHLVSKKKIGVQMFSTLKIGAREGGKLTLS
jgi:hypothetical protein